MNVNTMFDKYLHIFFMDRTNWAVPSSKIRSLNKAKGIEVSKNTQELSSIKLKNETNSCVQFLRAFQARGQNT